MIKEDKHFCHYGDEIKCDLQQLADKGIHAHNNHITTLINNSKFAHPHTKETLKLLLLWHVVKYYEAQDMHSAPTTAYIPIPLGPLQIT